MTRKGKKENAVNKEVALTYIILLMMIFWLLVKANSVTSLVCFIIGVCVIVGTRIRIFRENSKLVGRYLMVVGLCLTVLIALLGIEANIISSLGRDATLTGRTDIWSDVLDVDINPFIGTGYESFWLGDRAAKLWQKYPFRPNQAHNGYLETYLNLGMIGVFLLVGVLVSAYRNIRKGLVLDFDVGTFRLAFFIVSLVSNITEASFKGLSLMWFVLLLIGTEMPRQSEVPGSAANMIGEHDELKG